MAEPPLIGHGVLRHEGYASMSNVYEKVERQVHGFLESLARRPKLVKVIDELDSLVASGRDHLDAWSEIYRAFTSDDRELFALAGRFFLISAIAHLHAAALHAAKLTENHPDSVNLFYLLRLVEYSRPKTREQRHDTKLALRYCRERLVALEGDIAAVKELRDLHLAHVDRSRFNSGMNHFVVEAAALRRIFDGVDEVLESVNSLAQGTRTAITTGEDPLEDVMGPRGLHDLFYFARIATRDAAVPDPSAHSKLVRDSERALREVEMDLEEALSKEKP
jgi:hypothetical protein